MLLLRNKAIILKPSKNQKISNTIEPPLAFPD